jgi:hypothetical protein
MTDQLRTAGEIAGLIRARASSSFGPWPHDLQIYIFAENPQWRCGLSPATQASDVEYREGVLRIAKELQKTIKLVQ